MLLKDSNGKWNWRNSILIFTTLTKWMPRQYVTTIFNLCISICKHGLLTRESVSHIIYECDHIWCSHIIGMQLYSVLTISSCGISILELSKYWKERKKASKFFPNDLQYTSKLDASNWKSCIKKENEKENKGEGVVHVPSSPSWVRPLGPFTLGVRDSKCWVP